MANEDFATAATKQYLTRKSLRRPASSETIGHSNVRAQPWRLQSGAGRSAATCGCLARELPVAKSLKDDDDDDEKTLSIAVGAKERNGNLSSSKHRDKLSAVVLSLLPGG